MPFHNKSNLIAIFKQVQCISIKYCSNYNCLVKLVLSPTTREVTGSNPSCVRKCIMQITPLWQGAAEVEIVIIWLQSIHPWATTYLSLWLIQPGTLDLHCSPWIWGLTISRTLFCQNSRIDLTREAEECDSPVTETKNIGTNRKVSRPPVWRSWSGELSLSWTWTGSWFSQKESLITEGSCSAFGNSWNHK